MFYIHSLERLAQKIYTLSCFCLDLVFLLRPTRKPNEEQRSENQSRILLLGVD
jgi:hypothetical protein